MPPSDGWAFSSSEDVRVNSLRMPGGESLSESRMREICTSGSMRGE